MIKEPVRTVATRVCQGVLVLAAAYLSFLIVAYFAGAAEVRRHRVETGWFWFVAAAVACAWRARSTPAARPPGVVHPRELVTLLPLALATAWIAYRPSLGLGLLSDDYVLLGKALEGSFWRTDNELYRPLPLVLWRVAWAVAGAPWVLHAINITLHGVVGALAGLLARQAGLARAGAAGVAIAVALQPYSVEAVAWASGIQDLLMAVLVLAAVAIATTPGFATAVCVIALTAAALLSKETAVVTPALMLSFWWPFQQQRGRLWRNAGVATGVVGTYLLLRLVIVVPTGDYLRPPSRYLVKELIVRPFSTLGLPWHGHFVDAHLALASAFALVPVLLIAVAVGRNPAGTRNAMPLALWVLLAVAPVYSYFFISPDLEGSRYLYLGAPGWVIMLAILLRAAVAPAARAGWLTGAIAAVTLSVWGAGLAANMRPWLVAAQMRDLVVSEARGVSGEAGCGTLSFEALPDSVDGAYIFRNGWPEAALSIPRHPDGPDCRFRWNPATRTWERPDAPPPLDRTRPPS